MTMKEIKNKAYYEVKKAQENYKDNTIKYLEENNLRDKIIRVKDGKVGYLHLLSDYSTRLGYSVYFYPLKKDGTESKKYEIVWETNIVEEFIPYKD